MSQADLDALIAAAQADGPEGAAEESSFEESLSEEKADPFIGAGRTDRFPLI